MQHGCSKKRFCLYRNSTCNNCDPYLSIQVVPQRGACRLTTFRSKTNRRQQIIALPLFFRHFLHNRNSLEPQNHFPPYFLIASCLLSVSNRYVCLCTFARVANSIVKRIIQSHVDNLDHFFRVTTRWVCACARHVSRKQISDKIGKWHGKIVKLSFSVSSTKLKDW